MEVDITEFENFPTDQILFDNLFLDKENNTIINKEIFRWQQFNPQHSARVKNKQNLLRKEISYESGYIPGIT